MDQKDFERFRSRRTGRTTRILFNCIDKLLSDKECVFQDHKDKDGERHEFRDLKNLLKMKKMLDVVAGRKINVEYTKISQEHGVWIVKMLD